MPEQKPTFQVLIGNCDETLNGLFVQILQNVLKHQFELKATITDQIGQLSTKAFKSKFDLCILVLNNIQVPEADQNEGRIEWILDFVASLKAMHRMPVVALSGWTDEMLREKVQWAGADTYFELPVEPQRLKRAFERCIYMLGKWTTLAFPKKVSRLPNPDQMHLDAAQGWLGLGNHLEANEELEKITPKLRVHPDVLEVRWHIYAKAEKWEECLIIGEALVKDVPQRPDAWIHRSFALHELKRTVEASDKLLLAADLFPGHWNIAYNLACYACRLGNQEEAWDWLEDAFELGDAKQVKLMALGDPDLEQFWAQIGEMNKE